MTDSEKINNWIESLRSDLIESYDQIGLRASGNWERELELSYGETEEGYKITIIGAGYTKQITEGRGANSNIENIKAFVGWAGSTWLKDWVERKGINLNPFAIAWNIARKGITVPNKNNSGRLISDVITREKIENLAKDIGLSIVGQTTSDLKNIFK